MEDATTLATMQMRTLVFTIITAAVLTACHKSPSSPTNPSTPTTPTTPAETPPLPVVTGIDPVIGSADGGTVVTITGSGFTGVTNITFGGKTALALTADSDTSVTATAPAGTPGTVALAVVTTAGTSAPNDASQFSWDDNTLLDLAFPSASVRAGSVVSGSVTVRYPAPSTGLVLPLYWKITPDVGAALLFPQTAFVPSGSNIGAFQVTTLYSSSAKQLEVATAHGGQTKIANLQVTP